MPSGIEAPEADARLRQLVESALPGARVVGVKALGADVSPGGSSTKGAGYGAPLRIDLELGGARRSVVLHTATKNGFGHDRRADRAAEAVLARDTFGTIPGHVKALDVGAYRTDGGFVSLDGTGEFYLLSEWADGELFAERLRRIVKRRSLTEEDTLAVRHVATYLTELHAERLSMPFAQARALRDLFGSGEGIFGIVDGYPPGEGGVSPERLRRIEQLCHGWRWKLKSIPRPLVRTHGDFHPFNVLLDERGSVRLLDASRGAMGEAADDVTCMAINFPFFALEDREAWSGALSGLWYEFWSTYLERSRDPGVLEAAPPFLAWRGLVLASPLWYPALRTDSRERLLDFVETVLEAERFSADLVENLFR